MSKSIFVPRTKRPPFVLAVVVNTLRVLFILILALALAAAGAVVGIAKAYLDTAPTLDLTAIDDQAQTSFIYDSQGNLLTDYKGTENRIMVSIDSMPLYLQHAFVAVEDARFYYHSGIDVQRILGAFISNFTSGTNQGGSTITQQLIKNTLLSSEQSYKRKIQEAYLAMQLEKQYTKDEILQAYLNTIYMGEDYYGVQVAAAGYFGKSDLSTLTLRECAMLAGLANSPYYYNPCRNYYTRQSDTVDYPKITNDRTDYVLRCMLQQGYITEEMYLEALDPSTASIVAPSGTSSLYPHAHYVEYAVKEAISALLTINHLEDTAANRAKMEQELRTGGYHIFLALDQEIQQTVEDTLATFSEYPALRDPEEGVYRAKNADGTYDEIIQPQAAAVVMDYRTGEVKALVGSRTPPTQRKTLNRATDMSMPVGSSIKPLTVYAPAIESGAGAGSVAYNLPLPLAGWMDENGLDTWPQNYGSEGYEGAETFRTALMQSDNTAAAYILMNYVGVDTAADTLRRLGVSEKHINETPFGMALGSSGITPLEMAAAYSAFGNEGVYQEPIFVLGITDRNGNVIYDAHANQERHEVFSASTAYLTVDMMKDAVLSGTGTAAKIQGQTVAGKTGTNSDQKGVFFAGMTGWYCATVWIGHDNYESLSSRTTGGNSAAKLWNAFMAPIHEDLSNRDIIEGSPADYGLVQVTTCTVSGQIATTACYHDGNGYSVVSDWWPADSAPNVLCQMHTELSLCSDSHMLAQNYCPVTLEAGAVLIPVGHPLYRYLGTVYESVLREYFGEFATLRLTTDDVMNQAIIDSYTCPYHTLPQSSYQQALQEQQVRAAAQQLLSQGQSLLVSLSPMHPSYNQLLSAVNSLTNLLYNSASIDLVANAMSVLSQAMANVGY